MLLPQKKNNRNSTEEVINNIVVYTNHNAVRTNHNVVYRNHDAVCKLKGEKARFSEQKTAFPGLEIQKARLHNSIILPTFNRKIL